MCFGEKCDVWEGRFEESVDVISFGEKCDDRFEESAKEIICVLEKNAMHGIIDLMGLLR